MIGLIGLSDTFGYVKQRELSVGSRSLESCCEEKGMKSEGAISLSPGVHEKENRTIHYIRT